MFQFRFDSKLDPDGSKLRALLKAQIAHEHLSGFRSLYIHLMAIAALPLWLQAIWPNLFPAEIRLLILALWGGLFSLSSWAVLMEYLARRELDRRLTANQRETELTNDGKPC
jgi:hypothetical protein